MPLPEAITTGPDFPLYVAIRDGKVEPPDHVAIAAWAKQRQFDEPPDAEPSAGPLPIERNDPSAEPAVLVLISDGGWTPYDLGRLDVVLASWLRDEGLIPDDPSAPRPALTYRPEESPADLKSIVLRAEQIPSSRIESLAIRLGRKFPFLWSLDVGWPPR